MSSKKRQLDQAIKPQPKRCKLNESENEKQKENENEFANEIALTLNQIKTDTKIEFSITVTVLFKSKREQRETKYHPTPRAYFYVIVTDKSKLERKINFWSKEAENFNKKLKKGKVYKMSSLSVISQTNPTFAIFGDVEFNCEEETVIDMIKQEPMLQPWNFIDCINAITMKTPGELVDVIGMTSSVQDVKIVKTRDSRQTSVRNFTLLDASGDISVAAWGLQANQSIEPFKMIALKKARITDYKGFSLNVLGYICTNSKTFSEALQFKQSIRNLKMNEIQKNLNNKKKNNKTKTKTKTANSLNMQLTTLKTLQLIKETFRQTQELPKMNRWKVNASIDDIDRNNLWFTKSEKLIWNLKLQLTDETTAWIDAKAFQKPALMLLKGLTAEKAKQLKENHPHEFINLFENIMKQQKNETFYIYSQTRKFQNKQILDFVIEKIQH